MSEPIYRTIDYGESSRSDIEELIAQLAANLVCEIDEKTSGLTDEQMIRELRERQCSAQQFEYDEAHVDYCASTHALWMLRRALGHEQRYPLGIPRI